MRRPCRVLVALLPVAPLLVLGLPDPALAHPFGAPLRAAVESVSSDVLLRWTAAEDDWVALARHTGAFDEVPAGRDGGQRSGAERIARSQRLQRYLLASLTVAQDGVACPGEIVDFGDLTTEGVLVRFRCPEQIGTVDIGVSVLTDVHEAYRTVATAPGGGAPGRALYTGTEPLHRWDFAAAPPAAVDRVGAGLVAVLVAAAGVLLARALSASGRPARRAGRGPRRPSRTRVRDPGDRPATQAAPVHEGSVR